MKEFATVVDILKVVRLKAAKNNVVSPIYHSMMLE